MKEEECNVCTLNLRIISDHHLAGEIVFLMSSGIVSFDIEGLFYKNKLKSEVLIPINWNNTSFTILSGFLKSEKESVMFEGNLYSNNNHSTVDLKLRGETWKDEFYFNLNIDLFEDFLQYSLSTLRYSIR